MPIIVALALHAAWVVAAFYAVWCWHRLRELGGTPTAMIARARPGLEARFEGRAMFDGAARRSPLGGDPAVWFDWLVESAQSGFFAPRGGPIGIAADRSVEPFAIVDDGGYRLLVWPALAEMVDVHTTTWQAACPPAIDAALRDRLARGIDMTEPADDPGRLYFTERCLLAGERCWVIGRVEAPEPGQAADICGVIREGGEHHFLISAGVPNDAQASLRRRMRYGAIIAPVVFVLAMIATVGPEALAP